MACLKGYIEIVQYILAKRSEVDLSIRNLEGKTSIDIAKEMSQGERGVYESEQIFNRRIINCPRIVELLESFEKNPNEIRIQLRKQLGFIG